MHNKNASYKWDAFFIFYSFCNFYIFVAQIKTADILKFTNCFTCLFLLSFITKMNYAQVGLAYKSGIISEKASVAPAKITISKEFLSPFEQTLKSINDSILLDPTSPVLAKKFSFFLKKSNSHPEEIIKEIESVYSYVNREIAISAIAYLNTINSGIESYYKENPSNNNIRENAYEVVEPYAIPYAELARINDEYRVNLLIGYYQLNNKDLRELIDSGKVISDIYVEKKINSPLAKDLAIYQENIKQVLPLHYQKLVDLHGEISSAEAAYPRIQFSINGFTRHVYQELMNYEYLDSLLYLGYNLHYEWLMQARIFETKKPLFKHVIEGLYDYGFSYNEILLYLSYVTRNMPSLDIQYAQNSEKALKLEVYFWKTKNIYKEAVKNYIEDIYPNKRFKYNPGLYHYMTAVYLSYKVRQAGYSSFTAFSMGVFNKVGYKTHKLIHGINKNLSLEENITDIYKLAKVQEFKG